MVPPATRAVNGYRRFRPEHVVALRAYRRLAEAVGPVVARHVPAKVRALPLDGAAALVLLRDAALVGGYLDGVEVTAPAFVATARRVAGLDASA